MGYLRPAEPVLTAEIVIALPPYPATSSRAAEMGDPHLCFLAKPGTEAGLWIGCPQTFLRLLRRARGLSHRCPGGHGRERCGALCASSVRAAHGRRPG